MDVIRSSFDAVNARDIDAILAHFHPDVVFDATRIMEGTYSGHDEYRRFLEDLQQSTKLHWTPTTFERAGDHFVVVATVKGAGAASEAPVERIFAFRYWVDDGLIRRQEVYPDADAARGDSEER